MKAIATLTLLCGISLLTGTNALAKSVGKTTTTQKTSKSDSEPLDRGASSTTDYALSVASWDYNNEDPALIDVTFSAEFRSDIQNMDLCWTDDINSIDFPCWDNKVDVTDGDGILVWGSFLYTVDTTWWGAHIKHWQGSFDMNWGMFSGYEDVMGDWVDPSHEAFECDVDYKVKLRNGIWYDTLEVNFPCQEEEEEVCTDCPYGGYYDGAHCKVGTAPNGTSAEIQNGWYAYTSNTSTSTKCPTGTFLKSGACGVSEIPEETSSFVYNNAWYYHPVCE